MQSYSRHNSAANKFRTEVEPETAGDEMRMAGKELDEQLVDAEKMAEGPGWKQAMWEALKGL